MDNPFGQAGGDAMAAEIELPRRARRSWLRFSLRTAFLAVLVAGVLCAAYVIPAQRQQRATETLERCGILVAYDYQRQGTTGGTYLFQVQPPGWPAARKWLGKDFFQTVSMVSHDNAPLTVDHLQAVGQLSHLRDLWFTNCDLTDEHLKCVAGLDELRSILLTQNKITDAGLAHLAGMTELNSLALDRNGIHGSGLKHIRHMKKLETLALSDNPVTDDALANVADLQNLEFLGLTDSEVTDEGLKYLANLKKLRHLGLSGTYVTNVGAQELRKKLPQCTILSRGLRVKSTATTPSSVPTQ